MISSRDLCWLAGLWEGEGTFVMGPTTPMARIAMTDKDVIEKVGALLNHKVLPKKAPNPRNKPLWSVSLTGKKAIALMLTLYTLMGERRKQRIEEVVAEWKTRPLPWGQHKGAML